MQAEGIVSELTLLDGVAAARIRCPVGQIPAPGRYVLAHAAGSDEPLATVLFLASTALDGFLTSPPVPSTWMVGTRLRLRGPLGHGFSLPAAARRIALIAFRSSPRTLLSLIEPAFRQQASVALVSDFVPDELPLSIEIQPGHALPDVCKWADFVAFDVPRDALPDLKALMQTNRIRIGAPAQILLRTPMPCGALAACGVCAVDARGKILLACVDGPVFNFDQLMG